MNNNEIRKALLSRLKREKNGAVVDAVDALITKKLFSYGVSIPTIKSIVEPYKGNHCLALNLFNSNIRELKIAAIYIDSPLELTIDQVKEWSSSLSTLELFENVTFALFSKSDICDDIISYWKEQNDSLFSKGIELLVLHRKRYISVQ